MKIASFFAGIGGFDLAFRNAGHEIAYACEIDPFARAVYAARFGHEPQGSDINDVRASDIPEASIWVGGFPCQDLSIAGKRGGIHAARSGLVWKWLDLAADVRPKWILMENVPGLLSSSLGEDFGRLTASLDEIGYVGAWRVLDARFFGVPQRRRRVFILAGRADLGADPAAILLEPEGVRGRAASRGPAGAEVAGTLTARAGKGVDSDGNGREPVAVSTLQRGLGVRMDAESAAGGQLIPFDPGVRRLMPVECERLQGFPDDWTAIPWKRKAVAPDSLRYRALGNAVAVCVVEWIARRFA